MAQSNHRSISRRTFVQAGTAMGLGLGSLGFAASRANSQDATLYYPSWMLAEAGVGEYWEDSVDQFEAENTGIQLETTLIPSNEYEDKTLTQIAGGTAPDVYPVFTNMVPRLISLDLLEPLDDYLAEATWKDKELPALQVAQQDGQTYGVVLTASPQGLLYNQELLDRAGVGIPTTPQEFLDACVAVKEETGEWGYVFPMDTAQELNAYISTMQWVLGFGSDWAAADGTPTANAPETVEAMEWQMRFVEADVVPVGMPVLDTRNLFKDGKVAFMIDGPWVLTLVKSENPELYSAMGYEVPPTPTHAAITGGAFFVIPKASEHKDIAWQYINMINQEEWQRRWLEELVQVPGQNIEPSEAFLEENPWAATMMEVSAKYQAGFGYSPPSLDLAPHANEFRKLVMGAVAQIWNGSTPVAEALDDLQGQLEPWAQEKGIIP